MGKNSPQNSDHKSEYEFLVISGLIYDNSAWQKMPFLAADDFINPVCCVAFSAIQALIKKGTPIDFTILSDELVKANTPIRDMSPFTTAFADKPTISLIVEYGQRLREQTLEREFRNIGQLIQTVNCSDKQALDKALGKLDYWKSQKAALSSNGYDHLFTRGTAFMKQDFGQTEWLVPSLIPVASSGLVTAKPKVGKTTLDATLALGVSSGSIIFGKYQCRQGNVLFVNLDMSPAKFQGLLKRVSLGNSIAVNNNLDVISDLPRFDEGGIAILEAWCKRVPNPALILIAMLKDVKPAADLRASIYDVDSNCTRAVRPLIERYSVSVFFEHHANKRAADGDLIDLVSGSTGLSGSVDNNIIMTRGGKKGQGIISRVGRDYADDSDIHFVLERDGGYIREIDEVEAQSDERQQVIDAMNDGYCHAKEIADILGKKSNAVSNLLYKMLKDGLVEKKGYGKYQLTLGAKCGVSGVTLCNPNDDEAYGDTYAGVSESVTAKCGVSGVTSRNPNDNEARREFSPQFSPQLTSQVTPTNLSGVSCGVTSKLNNDVGLSGVLEQVTPLTPPFTHPPEKDKGQGKAETKGKPLNGKFVPLEVFITENRHRNLDVSKYLKKKATVQGTVQDHYYLKFVAAFKNEYNRNAGRVIRKVADEMGVGYPFSKTMGEILDSKEVQKEIHRGWARIKTRLSSQYGEDELEISKDELIEAGFIEYNVQKQTLKLLDN